MNFDNRQSGKFCIIQLLIDWNMKSKWMENKTKQDII